MPDPRSSLLSSRIYNYTETNPEVHATQIFGDIPSQEEISKYFSYNNLYDWLKESHTEDEWEWLNSFVELSSSPPDAFQVMRVSLLSNLEDFLADYLWKLCNERWPDFSHWVIQNGEVEGDDEVEETSTLTNGSGEDST